MIVNCTIMRNVAFFSKNPYITVGEAGKRGKKRKKAMFFKE